MTNNIGFRHTCRLYPELNTYSDTQIYTLYHQGPSCISDCPVSLAVWNERWLTIFKIICIIPINIAIYFWLQYDLSPFSIVFSINSVVFMWGMIVEGYLCYKHQLDIQNNPTVIQEITSFVLQNNPT